jgi:hypothetical protein
MSVTRIRYLLHLWRSSSVALARPPDGAPSDDQDASRSKIPGPTPPPRNDPPAPQPRLPE